MNLEATFWNWCWSSVLCFVFPQQFSSVEYIFPQKLFSLREISARESFWIIERKLRQVKNSCSNRFLGKAQHLVLRLMHVPKGILNLPNFINKHPSIPFFTSISLKDFGVSRTCVIKKSFKFVWNNGNTFSVRDNLGSGFDDLIAWSLCWPFNYLLWIGPFIEFAEKGSSSHSIAQNLSQFNTVLEASLVCL